MVVGSGSGTAGKELKCEVEVGEGRGSWGGSGMDSASPAVWGARKMTWVRKGSDLSPSWLPIFDIIGA